MQKLWPQYVEYMFESNYGSICATEKGMNVFAFFTRIAVMVGRPSHPNNAKY